MEKNSKKKAGAQKLYYLWLEKSKFIPDYERGNLVEKTRLPTSDVLEIKLHEDPEEAIVVASVKLVRKLLTKKRSILLVKLYIDQA